MNEKKLIAVDRVIEELSKLTNEDDRVSYIYDLINVNYLPYAEKISVCERIVASTYYATNEHGKRIFKINSPISYMLYCLNLVDLYTCIQIDFRDCERIFDLLNRNSVFDIITSLIDERELKEFNMVLDMVRSDVIQNEMNQLPILEVR